MPVWLGILGFVVSVIALVVSIRAFQRVGPLTEMQTRLAALELAERKGAQVARTKAEVRATIVALGQHAHRVLLENIGGAPAVDVDIEFLDEKGQALLPQGEREDKLPIPRLDPQRRVTLIAALAMGRYPPFKVAVSWTDPDGTRQRVEDTLYLDE